ncbi:cis-prenyltransferase [Schizosaccharomyces cryophilus OY26]|uniref:Alkyl transferase n=1 Tax=Schizosaccharomyces cryophilus (strain OY26 / ATCC MYA-4695 / CBS 11777 / NBRC 106824 / NRRL Y48691) TaxID=653667 RepID=S9XHL5_SCHCR|nr:cis-prenyltransferase [Schizosaccharomyces cryophilus OY26]EPY53171.1 cis-prenyltransferase [Schizosaccharomyces cryophilus OY26]
MGSLLDWLIHFPPLLWGLEQVEEVAIRALKHGKIPQHVAFVMDGNRRWAREHRVETIEGHSLGFETLKNLLRVCLKMGVKEVSTFAFSIENFKRSKHEVDALMDIAKNSLNQITAHGDMVDQYGIRIRIVGDLALLKPDVYETVVNVVESTKNNTRATLNVCFPYTSRHEISNSVQSIVHLAEDGKLVPEDIDESLFEKHLLLNDSHPLDWLIRTSGVERLSDFLLWQVHEDSQISFIDSYWPDFSIWRFFPMLIRYQLQSQQGE